MIASGQKEEIKNIVGSVYTHGNIKLIKVDIPMSVYIVEYFLWKKVHPSRYVFSLCLETVQHNSKVDTHRVEVQCVV